METSGEDNILPVWKVVKISYGDAYKHCQQLKIPLLVFSLVTLAQWTISAVSWGTWWGPAFTWILVIVFGIPFMVAIHRMVLLNEVHSGLSFLRFDKAALHYLGAMLLLGIVFFGGLMSSAYLLRYGSPAREFSAILNIFVLVLLFRLGFSLPAAAVGAQHPFTQSWKSTRGSICRLISVFFLTLLPFALFTCYVGFHLLVSIARESQGNQANSFFSDLPLMAIQSALTAIGTLIVIVAYSLCYDVLVRGRRLDDTYPL